MIRFDAAHAAVHYPSDRRLRVWVRPSIVAGALVVVALLWAAAVIQVAVAGEPAVPHVPVVSPSTFSGPHGFPLVVMTGFARNMNHIVMGTDDPADLRGVVWGFVGIAVVVAIWIAAYHVSWRRARLLQHAQRAVVEPVLRVTLNRLAPQQRYGLADVSPHLWPNGKLPTREDWKALAREGFRDYRLKVGGLVERPAELSLADLAALGAVETITMHHCIQGWSGIARWSGLPMRTLVELVKPRPGARVVAFFSFGEGLYGGTYYDTQRLENVLQPECLLAFSMNGAPLGEVYGAPLRLRVENQLGYKMVKWIERIEFVASERGLGKGEGGTNEDDEYFDLLPNI